MGKFRTERIYSCLICGYSLSLTVNLLSGEDKPELPGGIKCPNPSCGGALLTTTNLTPREVEVAREFTNGLTVREIAVKLNISIKTVESHKKMVYRKLLISDLANLTKYALLKGITRPEVRYRKAL
jgi:DNA-binding NarL/FixJ family response regulator